jgi:hypothetical protein
LVRVERMRRLVEALSAARRMGRVLWGADSGFESHAPDCEGKGSKTCLVWKHISELHRERCQSS